MLLCLVKGQSRRRLVGRRPMVVMLPSVRDEVLGGDSPAARGAPVLEVPARGEQPERCGRELGDDGAERGHDATSPTITMSSSLAAAWRAVLFTGVSFGGRAPTVGGGTGQG